MRKLLGLVFKTHFDESTLINVRVPQYFQKLGFLMRVAQRRYALVFLWYVVHSHSDIALHS